MPEKSIEAKESEKWHLDPAGCFKIEITDGEFRNGRFCRERSSHGIMMHRSSGQLQRKFSILL